VNFRFNFYDKEHSTVPPTIKIKWKAVLAVLILALWLPVPKLSAETDPEVRSRLVMIQKDLADIKADQQKILAGQDKLSKEHEQLRYWIYRK
jgi:hypothetical protein